MTNFIKHFKQLVTVKNTITLLLVSMILNNLSHLSHASKNDSDKGSPSQQSIISAIADGIEMEGETRLPDQTIVQCIPGNKWVCTGIKTASGAEYSATVEIEHIAGQTIILPAELTITKEPPYKELEIL